MDFSSGFSVKTSVRGKGELSGPNWKLEMSGSQDLSPCSSSRNFNYKYQVTNSRVRMQE